MDEKTIKLSTIQPYDWDTDEVSWREILKFVSEELNKDNYSYNTADILKVVNRISIEQYDNIVIK